MQKHTLCCSIRRVALPSQHAGKGRQARRNLQSRHKKSSSIDVSVCAMVCAFGGKTQLGEGHIVDEEMLCSGAKREKKALHHPQSGAARYHSLGENARRCSLAADCLYAPAYSIGWCGGSEQHQSSRLRSTRTGERARATAVFAKRTHIA